MISLARRRGYTRDLTDAQRAAIAPMIPDAAPGGRQRKAGKREIVKAIVFMLRAGCAWRFLPRDVPPWQTVYSYLRRWLQDQKCRFGLVIRPEAKARATSTMALANLA